MKQKITVLCLSGWAQESKSLASVFNDLGYNFEIINLHYSRFANINSLFEQLKNSNINPQIIIGWSLGGQLAMRIIEQKIFRPELLILLSTPFQFVQSSLLKAAMPQAVFDKFKNDFIKTPDRILKKFLALMLINDQNAGNNFKLNNSNFKIDQTNHQQLIFWLEELGKFSAYNINFKLLPPTLIIHGDKDMVVNVNQSKLFAKRIANSKLEIFNNCGHIPHLNNLEKLQKIIKKQLLSYQIAI